MIGLMQFGMMFGMPIIIAGNFIQEKVFPDQSETIRRLHAA